MTPKTHNPTKASVLFNHWKERWPVRSSWAPTTRAPLSLWLHGVWNSPVCRSRLSWVCWAACAFWSWTAPPTHPDLRPSSLCVRCPPSLRLPVGGSQTDDNVKQISINLNHMNVHTVSFVSTLGPCSDLHKRLLSLCKKNQKKKNKVAVGYKGNCHKWQVSTVHLKTWDKRNLHLRHVSKYLNVKNLVFVAFIKETMSLVCGGLI